jgi:ABC-type multidrug transport system permease subunit
MNAGPSWALVRKDIMEALRRGGLHIAMSVLGASGFALIPVMTRPRPLHMQDAEAASYRAALNAATNAQMPLLAFWIMTFAGVSIVSNLMTREKTRKTMIPTLKWTIASLVVAPLVSWASFGVVGTIVMLFTHAWFVAVLLSMSPLVLSSVWYRLLGAQHHARLFIMSSMVCLAVIATCWALAGLAPRERASGVMEWE